MQENFFFKLVFCWHLDPDPLPDPNLDQDPLVRGMDPRIQIRIHIKISWIRNTGFYMPSIPDGAVEGAVRKAHPVDKDVDEVLPLYEGTPDHAHLSARRLAHICPHLHTSVNQSRL
jgi:hypothetical protein